MSEAFERHDSICKYDMYVESLVECYLKSRMSTLEVDSLDFDQDF